ncbi:hypothetical protein ACLI4Q_05440 [Natrialbaceae archaeon A-CW1-1]
MNPRSRRRLLQTLPFVGLSTLAGCLDGLESEGDDTVTNLGDDDADLSATDEQSDVDTDTAPPALLLEEWAPTADVFDDGASLALRELDLEAVRNRADLLDDDVREMVTDDMDRYVGPGYDRDEIAGFLEIEELIVLEGTFDPTTVGSALEERADESTTREAITLYDGVVLDQAERIDDDAAIAVSQSAIAIVNPVTSANDTEGSTPRETLEAVLDTPTGSAARLTREYGDVSALFDMLEVGGFDPNETTLYLCERFEESPSSLPEGTRAVGAAWAFHGERVSLSFALVFDDGRPDETEIQDYFDEFGATSHYTDTQTTVTDSGAVFTGWIALGSFNFLDQPPEEHRTTPSATFDLMTNDGSTEATVTLLAAGRLDAWEIHRNGDQIERITDVAVGQAETVAIEPGDTIVIVGEYDDVQSVLVMQDI